MNKLDKIELIKKLYKEGKIKRFIKECPFCKKQFTKEEIEDLFVDYRGQAHCPDCGTRELDDISEE